MNKFVGPDGNCRIYALVDPLTDEVVETCEISPGPEIVDSAEDFFGRALGCYDVTSADCPEWLKDMVYSDEVFCRKLAQEMSEKGEEMQGHADLWRERADMAATATPSL